MQTFEGLSGAWNYTIGPALIYKGVKSIGEINLRALPVVVVAPYVPLDELGKMDLKHVYGFVLEGGGYGDPTRIFYSNQHRATVMRCEGILAAARPDQTIVVDGVDGKVFLDPDAETLARYNELRKQGPPPEPDGFAEQLVKDAMEMATLDPKALKEGFFDFDQIQKAMGTFFKMYQSEELDNKDIQNLKAAVKGTPVEAQMTENLKKYQDAAKNMSDEERAERQLRAPME